ncbi:MAG: M28 family peptidase [Ignavibacteriales bacterium]|nr:M28 family peptidase [Ignavibacteriales bacterium]
MRTSLAVLVVCTSLAFSQTPFSQDSAVSYLKTLSVEIGPRPMGSANERRAMEFALDKFRQFGLQEAYILPMTSFKSILNDRVTNVHSGTAVGVLKGTTDRIILIGGHIDSAGPDIPGANDDGSGSATVIELARVISQQQHEHTFVFCLFGGEELGLQGSKHFVEHFSQLDKIDLMLHIDMANGAEWLLPMFDAHTESAPRWLVRAAYDEFNKLPYRGLYYPLHFYTLNYAFGQSGAGSDHDAFLAKGIPAIDFTSDPNDPIHTPEDNFENFKPSGLKRSGDLVYQLAKRFDKDVPKEKLERYTTIQLGTGGVFIPTWAEYCFLVLSIGVAVFTLWSLRKRRRETDRATRPRFSKTKLFLLALIIQSCVWMSETVVGLFKGVRFPWLSDISGYFVLGFLAGLVGIWISLQLTPRLKLSRDPYRYYLGAFLFFGIILALFAFATPRIMMYPATGLLLLSAAVLVRNPLVRLLLWIASPHMMYRLIFSEAFGLFSHGFPALPAGLGATVAKDGALILFFALWSFPFLLGFSALYVDTPEFTPWISRLRGKPALALGAAAFLFCAIYLTLQPTFSREWRQQIRIEQIMDAAKKQTECFIRSKEYLNGSVLRFGGKDSTLHSKTLEVHLGSFPLADTPWVSVERTVSRSSSDSTSTIDIVAILRMKFRPSSLTINYSPAGGKIIEASSAFALNKTDRSASLAFLNPDSVLVIPLHLIASKADSLHETIEATFTQQAVRVTISHPDASIGSKTIVRASSLIHP